MKQQKIKRAWCLIFFNEGRVLLSQKQTLPFVILLIPTKYYEPSKCHSHSKTIRVLHLAPLKPTLKIKGEFIDPPFLICVYKWATQESGKQLKARCRLGKESIPIRKHHISAMHLPSLAVSDADRRRLTPHIYSDVYLVTETVGVMPTKEFIFNIMDKCLLKYTYDTYMPTLCFKLPLVPFRWNSSPGLYQLVLKPAPASDAAVFLSVFICKFHPCVLILSLFFDAHWSCSEQFVL